MKKINIAELLKGCPSGMELNCSMYENVIFDCVRQSSESAYPIHCLTKTNGVYNRLVFTQYGCSDRHPNAKCVIFPKGKTTWEGFQRPFKDGDVLISNNNTLCIYKSIHKTYTHKSFIDYYCGYRPSDNQLVIKEFNDSHFGLISEAKLATEEEKQKLFQAIKDNGYKWNAETKTLEKLVEPRFKVGNTIQDENGYKVKITEVNIEDECYGYESIIAKRIGGIAFSEQDNWKLVPNKFDINTLIPFGSRVLVRCSMDGIWKPAVFGFRNGYNNNAFYIVGGSCWSQCIPYLNNEHLCGTTNDCDEFYKTW